MPSKILILPAATFREHKVHLISSSETIDPREYFLTAVMLGACAPRWAVSQLPERHGSDPAPPAWWESLCGGRAWMLRGSKPRPCSWQEGKQATYAM